MISSLYSSCNSYPLSGQIEMTDSDKKAVVYLIEPNNFRSLVASYGGKVIDSAIIDKKGVFYFEQMPESSQKKMYLLVLQNAQEIYANRLENDSLELSNYIPFIYSSSAKVTISSSAKHFLKEALIQGNIEDNIPLIALNKKRFELFQSYQKSIQKEDEYSLILNEKALNNYQKSLVRSVPSDKGILLQALALRWASPKNDYERIPELIKEICINTQVSDPHHAWTKEICSLSKTLPLTNGDLFPNFPLPMLGGDTVNTYTLLSQKMTLIDFWASWCAPCRQENKDVLSPLWDNYHEKGFQIIGYALDSSEKGWKNALKKDGADRWLHSSHLQGDISPLFDTLKMSTIPSNYLLDENGIILAKNLHGEELKNWIIQHFDKNIE